MDTLEFIYFILQSSLRIMSPLLIVAIGALISEKSGVTNIALEGIMLLGAFFGIYVISLIEVNTFSPEIILLIGVLVGGLSGLVFSALHAFASIHMKANQIISATALNLFVPGFSIYLARTVLNESGVQQIGFITNFRIREIPILSQIPFIGDIFFTNTYLSFYIGLAVLGITIFILQKTRLGLRLRACGENPHAADAAGVHIYKMRYIGVLASGLLAGVGGVVYLTAVSNEYNATVSGMGFLALAVLVFGNWKPMRILLGAFLFGLLTAVSSPAVYPVIPGLSDLHLPSEFYSSLPYIMTLIVLVFSSKQSNMPKASGQIYDKGQR